MSKDIVDYDQVAPSYNHRFEDDPSIKRIQVLRDLARNSGDGAILEVGCGTGFWLANLAVVTPHIYGLDYSAGMLRQAQERPETIHLSRGAARHLPYKAGSFGLVYCFNALHHFSDPKTFILETYRLLKPGGIVAVIGSTPHEQKEDWYIYDYFTGTYEKDAARFPQWSVVEGWIRDAGFDALKLEEIDFIDETKTGRDVLDDPFLQKNACSQLALLTDEEYSIGIEKIKTTILRAEEEDREIKFHARIRIQMLSGVKQGEVQR